MTHPHYFLHEYHPYWIGPPKQKNPDFDGVSGQLLDLKKDSNANHESAVRRFSRDFDAFIDRLVQPDQKYVIALVPSHQSGSTSNALARIAAHACARRQNMKCIPDLLRRSKTIDKLASGGDRSVSVHIQSIEVVNPNRVKGVHVIVLDDISTTGNSLEACEALLRYAGARAVTTIVLGKTTHA